MFHRARSPERPTPITVDDVELTASEGEPLAAALLAADITTVARSPKLHRPRSAACFRGGCDGCLARVNGVPNVMTCLRPVVGGEKVETQNYLGSRKADLLRISDWFFPDGIDHHHLLVGIPGVSDAMQAFARKLAGLGRLPKEPLAPQPARRLDVEVLVVGAGLAGLTAAAELSKRGLRVALVDDGSSLGGGLAGLEGLGPVPPLPVLRKVQVFLQSTVAGLYAGEALVATPEGAVVITARGTLLATGAHDPVVAVPNNDLPGVMSAKAVAKLLGLGIEPTGLTVIAGPSFYGDLVKDALAERALRIETGALRAIQGSAAVKRVVLLEKGREIRRNAAVLALAEEGAPAFELGVQAGARTAFVERGGYRIVTDEDGRAAEGLWAAGEVTGMAFQPAAVAHQAARVASALAATLQASPRPADAQQSGPEGRA